MEISSKSKISVDRDIFNVAQQLVSQCISMGVKFIEIDPQQLFVYKDPFADDVRPERRSSDSRRSNRKDSKVSKDFAQSTWDQEEDKVEKKRSSLKSMRIRPTLHGRLEKFISHDSDISLISRKYSYKVADTTNRESVASNDSSSRRSTFEHIIFRHKTKQSEQEQLWDYVMSDSSTASDSEDIAELEKVEIEILEGVVYDLPTIENFELTSTVNTIREYVTLWKVSPTTRFAVLKNIAQTKTVIGNIYRVTVAFSQPTKMCPNPLAVAYVYFNIYYSFVMPSNYPVMITYEFETYKHQYLIMGKRNMRSITFQNYYIESILNAKLSFYVQLFENTHGPLNQKPVEFSAEEEYEMYNKENEKYYKLTKPNTSQYSVQNSNKAQDKMSLLEMTRGRSYSLLILEEEPWKMGIINAEVVDELKSSIKEDEKALTETRNSAESEQDKIRIRESIDIFLHNE